MSREFIMTVLAGTLSTLIAAYIIAMALEKRYGPAFEGARKSPLGRLFDTLAMGEGK